MQFLTFVGLTTAALVGASPVYNRAANEAIPTPQPYVNGTIPTPPVVPGGTPLPTPPSGGSSCGGRIYVPGQYVCHNEKDLCPVLNGVTLQSCAGQCYDPAFWKCQEGRLQPGQWPNTPGAPVATPPVGTPVATPIATPFPTPAQGH